MAKATFEQKLIRTVSVGLVVGLIAYAVTYEEESTAPPTVDGTAEAQPVAIAANPLANLPYKGAENAKVVIIESSEFQWPYCSRVGPTIKQIVDTYPNDVAIYFFQNPLSFHDRAMPAAKASMAAHQQGKFWQYHDLLFANQKSMTDANILKWAKDLSLDMAKFKKDMADPELEKEILRQQAAMVALGARGTPAFFLNGKKMAGAKPFTEFQKEIDAELVKINQRIAGGANLNAARTASMQSAENGANFIKWVIQGQEPPGVKAPAKPTAKKTPPKPKKPIADEVVWRANIHPDDARKGGKQPLVTLVEFSDFQWPFCSKVGPTLMKIIEAYGEDVAVVYKHNPLDFHKEAFLAAEASLAANDQGKFWEYHDLLFANMKALQREKLEEYAQQLGLDMVAFNSALDLGVFKEQVARDIKLAKSIGIKGAPNTVVNGRQVSGAVPFEDFKKIIDEEIKKAKKKIAGGVSRAEVYNATIARGKIQTDFEEKVNYFSYEGSPAIGDPATAKIVITEFSEFQWPYCSGVGPALAPLKDAYGDDLAIVFKHFPLDFHKEAALAAEASLAAGEEGKFWGYHDILFDNQKALQRPQLERYAELMGLDMEKFKAHLDNRTFKTKVDADMSEGRKAGVRGTPSVFVNGRRANVSWRDSNAFKASIDRDILGR